MKTKIYLLTFLIASLLLVAISCAKKITRPDCSAIEDIKITQNGPLNEGKSLVLKIPAVMGTTLRYTWTGPRGWTFVTNDSAEGHRVVRTKITKADAGTYSVQILDRTEGCVRYEGSVAVAVTNGNDPLPPTDTTGPINPTDPNGPQAPCSVTINTTNSDGTTGSYSFKFISFTKAGSTVTVKASEKQNGDFLELKFNVTGQLATGTYKSSGTNAATANGKVGLHIKTVLLDYIASADNLIYVSKKDGKLQISFCSVKFAALLSQFTSSGRVVEP